MNLQPPSTDRRWLWATLLLSCTTIVAFVFATWELVEHRFFESAGYLKLHFLYITRGVVSSLLLATWAAWYVLWYRRRSEESLHLSLERQRRLLESIPGAMALYDFTLRVIEWNGAAEKLYGFSKAEVIGKQLPTMIPGKEQDLAGLLDQVRQGRKVVDVETLRCHKTGESIEVQLTLLPFRDSDGQKCILDVTTDIRERVRMREKILDVEKLTTMGRMAAGTAHHLNTPLGAMLLRIQMMRNRMHDQACRADLERLETGIRNCQQFVTRLLTFAHRGPSHKVPENVVQTLQTVVSFLAPTFNAKNATVSLSPGNGNCEQVLADRHHLEALFSAILTNALDAISPGGKIDIQCIQNRVGWLEIRIADNGAGIKSADRARIFEPFFTTKSVGKGTGLGLAIARNIALDHGGQIRLESKPGKGTTALIELPLYQKIPNVEKVQ